MKITAPVPVEWSKRPDFTTDPDKETSLSVLQLEILSNEDCSQE